MSDFLNELIKRLAGKTLWFFKVIQVISAIIAVVMLGPDLISFLQGVGIELPTTWTDFIMKAVGIASIAAAFIAKLTVTTKEKEVSKIPD